MKKVISEMLQSSVEEYKVLSKEEEKQLFKKMRKGDQTARNVIILSNLRLIAKIAGKYSRGDKNLYEELFSEAEISLIKAVDSFDINKGLKFSTFATIVIRNDLIRFLVNKNGAKDNYIMFKKRQKIIEMIKQGLPIEEVKKIMKANKTTIKRCLFSPQDYFTTSDLDKKTNFEQVTEEEKINISDEEITELLEKANLSKNERYIVAHVLGIEEHKSQAEIAMILNKSQQVIRQLYRKACEKIKQTIDSKEDS
ncbi:MAG: hypothetical protein COS15_03485 [Caldiserica bacterium CG02_land_8_20_14_3_00_36_38]|nr:MAG: hypothetical protein AUJ99_04655 [Caldisericum sp. CG2_30_36_11]PIV55475.1 MAG: hypothetical protein COS15_03485 [Caldiserica bacterium CG02_land_8_20_14_3_00_36_38]PIW10463.1 MAG: hypothetical protein COW37_03245 [Caldiserica bacterium CG17_big_fil_post_rev_8_21_14_2_50_35_7]